MNLDDNPVDAYGRGLKEGADRERRRIRRAQAPLIKRLEVLSRPLADGVWRSTADALERATRKGAGRKKGRK